ncbi:MAG TPA: nucleoside triphosphate pyrophosphohydrolase [Oceanospirillales bacterium]|nr:nucleoside triphosphate pyrophosphohydrolase [Oceanospirillales bacterium]
MNNSIQQLLDIMAQLRNPEFGCPWDQQQDFESLTTYTIEEAYEVADAVDQQDYEHLEEELGDLLFQVVFYAQLAEEKGLFDFNDVVQKLNTKMIERHPHVFTENKKNLSAEQQNTLWEQIKFKQRAKSNSTSKPNSVLDDIPDNLPELLKSIKLTKRAAVIGFDWPDIDPVFTKMDEEIGELKEAMATGNNTLIKDELGDVLFVCTNLARHLKIDPQLALRHANMKFEKRFRAVEKLTQEKYPTETFFDLSLLDGLWTEVKKKEK